MSKEIQTEIQFDELIDHITIIPDKYYRTADILFGKYMINIDLHKACCETYYIYINGKDYHYDKKKKKQIIYIQPSNSVIFTFGEKEYLIRKDSSYMKNYMTIKFSGGDRIRVIRDEQYCGVSHSNIYVRPIYLLPISNTLESGVEDDKEQLLGFV